MQSNVLFRCLSVMYLSSKTRVCICNHFKIHLQLLENFSFFNCSDQNASGFYTTDDLRVCLACAEAKYFITLVILAYASLLGSLLYVSICQFLNCLYCLMYIFWKIVFLKSWVPFTWISVMVWYSCFWYVVWLYINFNIIAFLVMTFHQLYFSTVTSERVNNSD